jgi:hypothetical protein
MTRNASTRILPLLAAGALLLTATVALAAERRPPRGPPPGPPPEAIEACSGKAAAAACEMAFGDGTLTGTCATAPGGVLACRPAHLPPPPSPPPEAVQACSGQTAGAQCAVTLGGNTLDGTCIQGPDEGLACLPSKMPPPPQEG